jgi:phosphatidylglycerophosphatase A
MREQERSQIISTCIASTFWSGYSPVAPGTVGSLIAILALWLAPAISPWLLTVAATGGFFLGVWASGKAEDLWGHDAGRVNWDEVIGMMISVIALPKSLITYSAAFLLFRLLDIIKPFPANVSQKLPRGWGIMTDDLIAAAYSNLILQIAFRFIANRG